MTAHLFTQDNFISNMDSYPFKSWTILGLENCRFTLNFYGTIDSYERENLSFNRPVVTKNNHNI